MTIRVELQPEIQAHLAAEARARGMTPGGYARTLIQEAISAKLAHKTRASQEEFRKFLDRLGNKAPNVPELRSSNFSREMIYGEHD